MTERSKPKKTTEPASRIEVGGKLGTIKIITADRIAHL